MLHKNIWKLDKNKQNFHSYFLDQLLCHLFQFLTILLSWIILLKKEKLISRCFDNTGGLEARLFYHFSRSSEHFVLLFTLLTVAPRIVARKWWHTLALVRLNSSWKTNIQFGNDPGSFQLKLTMNSRIFSCFKKFKNKYKKINTSRSHTFHLINLRKNVALSISQINVFSLHYNDIYHIYLILIFYVYSVPPLLDQWEYVI